MRLRWFATRSLDCAFFARTGLVLFVCALLNAAAATIATADEAEDSRAAKETRAAGIELFEKQIRPVLVDECYSCHSQAAEMVEGGLELDSPEGLTSGGDSGPIINRSTDSDGPAADGASQKDAAKSAATSLLIRMLRHEDGLSGMPPEEKLSEETLRAFERWIELGAPDPRASNGLTSAQLQFEQQKRHWAFQPPQTVAPPTVEQTDWPRSAIDAFVLTRLESQGLHPVADATRATLVRRLYFDLIGLPPTPQQVRELVEDDSPEAVSNLVNRLLASSRFGERWARYWLDVVRYAESSGKEFNFTYPHAWPFRDYVIDALNSDKPYDQFVIEQVAGDLLPEAPYESASDREARLIAPSMLACGPKRHNSGGMDFRMGIVDDQIDVTCRAILGLTVACAKCHDHKFDPIPTQDYYALAGIFLSTDPLYGTIKQKYSNNPTDLLPIGPNGASLHAAFVAHEKKIAAAEKPWKAKQEELKKAEEAVKGAADKEKKAAEVQVAKLKEEIAPLQTVVEKLKKARPPQPAYAMSARDRAKPADTKIAIRGDYRKLGNSVSRGFLSALEIPDAPVIDPQHSGRLELAQWLTSEHNPLTARVIVNRVWYHLLGRGLVESVDNFGLMGKEPSHPQLLDSLSVQFMRDGWSIKQLIQKIVLSRTYQLSCQVDESNQQLDPGYRQLWRGTPRRLSGEAGCDSILAISGQLNLDPPHSSSVTDLGDQMVRGIALEKLQPTNNHRSIYLPVVRDYLPDLFDRFDFPSPSLVSGRRMATNVPAQALYLRNSPFVTEQALHTARRLLASGEEETGKSDAGSTAEGATTGGATTDGAALVEARVDRAMRWALARPATEAERQAALALILPILSAEPAIENGAEAAWAALFRALFATAEFRYLVDIESWVDSSVDASKITSVRAAFLREETP
ncbi:MAG: DUF1553 domain-containing protein [Pirellulales bacterium]